MRRTWRAAVMLLVVVGMLAATGIAFAAAPVVQLDVSGGVQYVNSGDVVTVAFTYDSNPDIPGTTVSVQLAGPTTVTETVALSDGTDVAESVTLVAPATEGTYDVVVTVENNNGIDTATGRDMVVVDNTAPTITELYADRYFSPNGDGVQDTATITWNLSETADWTVNVERFGDSVWSDTGRGSGDLSTSWDGLDGGTALADNNYVGEISAADLAGNTTDVIPLGFITIDTGAPTATITSPTAGDALTGTVEVTGTATDAHFESFEVSYSVDGGSSWTQLNAGNAGINSGTLASFNTTGLTGDVTLRLTVEDAAGNSSQDTVQVTIAEWYSPVAVDDHVTVISGVPTGIYPMANDYHEFEAADLFWGGYDEPPSHGTLVDAPGYGYTYTSDSGYVGDDSFTYMVYDAVVPPATSTQRAFGTVYITVLENQPPAAVDDYASTPVDQAVTVSVLANDGDPEETALTLVSHSDCANGTIEQDHLAYLFTPSAGFEGIAQFDYTISDQQGLTDTATVYITVGNPAPAPEPEPPVADPVPTRGSLQLAATTEADEPLAGATFRLTWNGIPWGTATYTTGDDGTVTIAELPTHDYNVLGVSAPTGYRYESHELGRVSVKANRTTEAKFVLIPVAGTGEPVTPVPVSVTDIDGHWAREQVACVLQAGIVDSPGDGLFHPDAAVTRAQFIQMLRRALAEPQTYATRFSDVVGHAAEADIATAEALGWLNADEYDAELFGPDETLQRQEMARLSARALGLQIVEGEQSAAGFSDIDKAKPEFVGYIGALEQEGLLYGYPDGTFHPGDSLTRAEAAAMIARAKGLTD